MKLQSHQMSEPSDDTISQLPDDIQEYIAALQTDLSTSVAAIQRAYGYLWIGFGAGKHENDTRKMLLGMMDKDDQKSGINMAVKRYGHVTEYDILMRFP